MPTDTTGQAVRRTIPANHAAGSESWPYESPLPIFLSRLRKPPTNFLIGTAVDISVMADIFGSVVSPYS